MKNENCCILSILLGASQRNQFTRLNFYLVSNTKNTNIYTNTQTHTHTHTRTNNQTHTHQGRIFRFFRGGQIHNFSQNICENGARSAAKFLFAPPWKIFAPPLIYHFRGGQIFSRVGQKFFSPTPPGVQSQGGGKKIFAIFMLKKAFLSGK